MCAFPLHDTCLHRNSFTALIHALQDGRRLNMLSAYLLTLNMQKWWGGNITILLLQGDAFLFSDSVDLRDAPQKFKEPNIIRIIAATLLLIIILCFIEKYRYCMYIKS